ncbi:hypothetical protein CASFOL_029388 [Castilleja foliolosa]|uniref:Uncharacterized protein n=1 Tax=Castilleja foliolosa TaxID=1961234 RepID=A0ABD3CCM7_9LAMI
MGSICHILSRERHRGRIHLQGEVRRQEFRQEAHRAGCVVDGDFGPGHKMFAVFICTARTSWIDGKPEGLHVVKADDKVLVSILSIGSLFVLSKTNGFIGIWVALTIYMGLRTFAGFWRWELEQGHGTFLRVVDHRHRTTYDRRVVIRQGAATVVGFGSHRRVVLGRR